MHVRASLRLLTLRKWAAFFECVFSPQEMRWPLPASADVAALPRAVLPAFSARAGSAMDFPFLFFVLFLIRLLHVKITTRLAGRIISERGPSVCLNKAVSSGSACKKGGN